MIAEDDILISESLKEQLEKLGHTVIATISRLSQAREALEMMPDFCFLDIRMRGKDEGFDIAELINNEFQIPFLFLTSFEDRGTVIEASKHSPSAYLVKPFKKGDTGNILDRIERNVTEFLTSLR